ncbi:Y4yA family PLP-dependent enzyme, partial [Nocardia cyriacigeorgica]|nr:Y4yA family PLP-dependent enzyme [Nocardia cyriacigeorgica]
VLPPASASRFGISAAALHQAHTAANSLTAVRLAGFSFHRSGYDPVPRAELAAELVDRCLYARTLGHPADTIPIGGGIGVDYVPAEAWSGFTGEASRRWFHTGK